MVKVGAVVDAGNLAGRASENLGLPGIAIFELDMLPEYFVSQL